MNIQEQSSSIPDRLPTNTKSSIWSKANIFGLFLREVVGWVLLGMGLYLFSITVFQQLPRALAIEGIVTSVIGIFLFRGGLQLVKVSVAARAL